ncbi:MAG: hypothetical protein JO058_01545 [Alphaproteobacteria bacterium]|nr:hypothetical protein [Alphaproteobacteria bacterium]
MGLIFKTILAACIGWGALYAAQHYWLGGMMDQVAEVSKQDFLPPAPDFPKLDIDPEKLQQAMNPQLNIDTKKYERLAIESQVRQIEQMNRNALSHVPTPGSLPGLHH